MPKNLGTYQGLTLIDTIELSPGQCKDRDTTLSHEMDTIPLHVCVIDMRSQLLSVTSSMWNV